MMPANGLQYAPPHPCVCYIDEKLNGFNALAPAIPETMQRRSRKETGLLEKGPAFGKASGAVAGDEDWPMFRHDAIRSCSVETKVPAKPKLLWRKRVGSKPASPIVVDSRLFVPLVDEHQVVAVNGSDGERQWEYTAGGRIDSPPTYYRGTVLFGSADGCVYCVRAGDGRLVWRFRAAPEERLIGAFGQLESAWPVHGSILVIKGIAYFAAGRSSHLDGGIYLFGVDAVSGEVRYKKKLQGPYYNVNNISQNYKLRC
jgi:outer membrane protein assembly factor BamB